MDTITDKSCLPDTARWDALAREFREDGAQDAPLPATLCAEVPVAPYGERVGWLRRFLRRVARRAVRWYAEPLIEQQNRVNRALLAQLQTLSRRVEALEEVKRP